jgi:hypothetical protein
MDAFENFLLESAADLIWDHVDIDEVLFDEEEDDTIDICEQLEKPYFEAWLRSLAELTHEQIAWIHLRTWDLLNEREPEQADIYAIWFFRTWKNELRPTYHLVLYFLQASENTIHSILRGKRLLRNLVEEMEEMDV